MGTRILVVDDDRLIRAGLAQCLQQAGYDVEQAASGSTALAEATRDMPDLVLLDYKLPDGSGIDVLRAIRKLSPRTPVVMITGHASIGGAVEAMRDGASDYIAKPFEMEDLLRTVQRALETSDLREQVARHREDA